jgi:hypothetical protein
MRISYYGYAVKSGDKKFVIDLRAFIHDFVASPDKRFKSKLTYNGESLYLLPLVPHRDVYLFVQSRDKEIIKAIERNNLSVADIQNKLQTNESVGFASYVLVDACWIGIASRVLAPRISAFSHLMTQIFIELNKSYIFSPIALTDSLPKSKIASLKHVGAVSVEMDVSNTVCQTVLGVVTGLAEQNLIDVGSVEIRITPLRKGKKNLKRVLAGVANSVPTDGLEALEARAKIEETDRVTDMYIVGQGGLRDFVPEVDEADVPITMKNLATNNSKLQAKASAFAGARGYVKVNRLNDLGLAGKFPSTGNVVVA